MPQDTPIVEPVVLTTKAALVTAVAAGVERAVEAERKRREAERPEPSDGFGWLPLKEVQRRTGWSKATLARKRADGSLPYALIGQSVFVHLDDLRALMERHRVGTTGEPS